MACTTSVTNCYTSGSNEPLPSLDRKSTMTLSTKPTIVWFRTDLRLRDNPAFAAAAKSGCSVLPVFVLDNQTAGVRPIGGAAQWWLHHSLQSLAKDLSDFGLPLILRRGESADVIADLVLETDAEAVYWNRQYDAAATARDGAIKTALKESGVNGESFGGGLMAEPWTIKTKQGNYFKVYTPFWRAFCAAGGPKRPLGDAPVAAGPSTIPASDLLGDWDLVSITPDWAAGFRDMWQPGESGAADRLTAFMDDVGSGYDGMRNFPAVVGTSGLSPHLHFGEIDPRRAWFAVYDRFGDDPGTETFRKELVWREFAHHVLFHVPDLPSQPMNQRFHRFPWRNDDAALRAWQRGQTGYPIVDAGMRELWHTGTMHNRVRMVVASFLVKHLLLPWQDGEAWFWDTLADADLAANTFNWQWVSGCGADAAPYFRIFNPQLQGEKFDKDGAYVRRWVPELSNLPNKMIHAPWTAKPIELQAAGVTLGKTYPAPIVDHKAARDRAMAAFKSLKKDDDAA